MKKIIQIFLLSIIALVFIIIGSNLLVNYSSKNQIYDNLDSIPKNKVGMLLGTSKYLAGEGKGRKNRYFVYRVKAAYELYEKGKIDYILVSGDNRQVEYNEPKQMKQDLMEMGVPEAAIVQDFAGRRTLDSVIRTEEIFGQKKFTIISQAFHNKRAVFLANQKGYDVVAYNAKAVNTPSIFLNNSIREALARVKAVLDIIINKKPEIGGDREVI